MNLILQSFTKSLSVFRKDKLIILLSLVPILVGIGIYYLIGNFLFIDVLTWAKAYVMESITGVWATVLVYFIGAMLSVLMWFVVSWTFVLLVSLIAAPFNDIISNRVEKVISGGTPESLGSSFTRLFSRIVFTFKNEIKKISFILAMSLIALLLNFVPIIGQVLSLMLSALLLAIGFIDYSWSRHDLDFGMCLSDARKSVLPYSFSGVIFMGLFAMPVVNLITLPFAVVYFTVFFVSNNQVGNVGSV